jgi:microcystin-dependent protein
MPRNGSGTHSIPNSFSSGSTISSSAMNANFTDIATEITGSLPRDGQAGMTGQFKAASGTIAVPGLSFGSDTDTGFYRKASNTIGAVVGGTEVGTIDSNGFNSTLGVLVPIPTGVILCYGATTAPTGWVRCNARTIGNASSGATERANADTETLFAFLWNNYGDSVCAVSSGRGASAAADYAANKTIALPDLRGRGLFGLDDMGNSAASRLGSVITSQTINGASGGSETVTLSEAQLPSHTHTGTTASDGAHTHTVPGSFQSEFTAGSGVASYRSSGTTTTSSGGAHTHTFTTAATGSGQAHSNMPPAFLTTFIIKL